MGMVLTVERLVKEGSCPLWDSVSSDVGFDVAKYVDDETFNNALGKDIDCDYVGCTTPYCCGVICCRPKNLNEAIDWVDKNIKTKRGDKLKEVLEIMKHDDKLYFEYS